MVYFLWMGFNCLKARDTFRGGSLLFTTKFPEIPGTHSKKCSPNGNPYIFSADLTRLTKMFSLSCSYLYILNMYAKTASYRPFSLYFFFP